MGAAMHVEAVEAATACGLAAGAVLLLQQVRGVPCTSPYTWQRDRGGGASSVGLMAWTRILPLSQAWLALVVLTLVLLCVACMQVVVICPSPGLHYLCVTADNIMQVRCLLQNKLLDPSSQYPERAMILSGRVSSLPLTKSYAQSQMPLPPICAATWGTV